YAGVMIDAQGNIKVLEFNCRFGDPETQPIMMRLQSDLPKLCLSALAGTLDKETIVWDKRAALGVVMASGGYPEHYEKGHEIFGLDAAQANQKIFIAGAETQDGKVINTGGRVLCVCALGDDVSSAQQLAYALVKKVTWK